MLQTNHTGCEWSIVDACRTDRRDNDICTCRVLRLCSGIARLFVPGRPGNVRPVPQGWVLGVADIVDSTGEIAKGRYKTVNMVGAAVISAMINALGGRVFPYVFGGDGAAFAIDGGEAGKAETALAALRSWAKAEFDIALRAALVPVADIRAADRDLRVARHAPSSGVDYAMFAGGGLHWAEEQLKAGAYAVTPAGPGTQPDLTGLSCRWSNSPGRHGQIVSLVIEPTQNASEQDFARPRAIGPVCGRAA